MTELSVRVYSPEPLLGHPAKLVGTIAGDIWAGRELAWRLFIRDLSARNTARPFLAISGPSCRRLWPR